MLNNPENFSKISITFNLQANSKKRAKNITSLVEIMKMLGTCFFALYQSFILRLIFNRILLIFYASVLFDSSTQ